MTAKEYLSQARTIKTRLIALGDQLGFLKSSAGYCVPQFSGMPKSATRNFHRFEDSVIRVMEHEEKMNALLDKLAEITDTINLVADPNMQVILTKRYLGGLMWEEIAQETFICERHIRRLHGQALREVEAILNDSR